MTSTGKDVAIAVVGGLSVFRFAEILAVAMQTDQRDILSTCLVIDPKVADEFIDRTRSFLSIFGQVNAQKTNTVCDSSKINIATSDPTLMAEIIKIVESEPGAANPIALSQILEIDSGIARDLIECSQAFARVCKQVADVKTRQDATLRAALYSRIHKEHLQEPGLKPDVRAATEARLKLVYTLWPELEAATYSDEFNQPLV